eukprot:CAMPEP_0119476184 /NCGR_PEP_ID=MMETSP1344-20130328/6796_1 /TAXON_ID=236787 /ORGANISM="Florenciella parvula, Strain CCMP2471" /LENGTH=112 /DNA_ID=CAMNT_0007509885 /DNA_START=239 /DNA_END=577 /DNA_ORIENTATION=-
MTNEPYEPSCSSGGLWEAPIRKGEGKHQNRDENSEGEGEDEGEGNRHRAGEMVYSRWTSSLNDYLRTRKSSRSDHAATAMPELGLLARAEYLVLRASTTLCPVELEFVFGGP